MKRENNSSLLFRYLILIVLSIFGASLFYYFFLPLTKYPVYWIFDLFYNPVLKGHIIQFSCEKIIEIIGPCVAGSAYLLLAILNLSTPKMKVNKRIKMIALSFGIFLIINWIRILILGFMYLNDSVYFEISHKIFWYGLNTIFVVGIWFWQVKKFKIKEIPFYSDLKGLYRKTKR